MKITDIKVNQLRSFLTADETSFVGQGGRLIVRVYTDEGITGIAEGSRGLDVFHAYNESMIKPLLIGENPLAASPDMGETRAGRWAAGDPHPAPDRGRNRHLLLGHHGQGGRTTSVCDARRRAPHRDSPVLEPRQRLAQVPRRNARRGAGRL